MSEPGTNNSTAIRRYQQKCFREYARSVGLPEPYTYPDGNPIRPLPPTKTATGGLMIVGAYPSARFESRPSTKPAGRNRLVPVADNTQPFGEEEYFDGTQVRRLESGHGLREYILEPLGLTLADCWVTDLVKVFLYKPEHVDSCGDACSGFTPPETRTRFMTFARDSVRWIAEECELCQPRLILTLGEEVAKAISGDGHANADDLLNRPICQPESLGSWPTMFLPHPDACRRSDKWREHMGRRLELARVYIEKQS